MALYRVQLEQARQADDGAYTSISFPFSAIIVCGIDNCRNSEQEANMNDDESDPGESLVFKGLELLPVSSRKRAAEPYAAVC